MEAGKVPQSTRDSGKKKKKKKKKRDHPDESQQSSDIVLDSDADASTPNSSDPLLSRENFGIQCAGPENSDLTVCERIEPAVKDSRNSDVGDVSNVSVSLDREVLKASVCRLPSSSEFQSGFVGSGRKKKKKKKNTGFLPSDALNNQTDAKAVEMEKKSETEENDLKRFSDQKCLLQQETKERNHFCKITTLMYKVGLENLRKLFMEIHPNWTNTPVDAKNLNKGKMMLQHHECALFDTGDINKWDVSLITTVLLYTEKCCKIISKKEGFEKAIRNIKDQKNKLISHRDSEKMTDDEFQQAWDTVSKSLETIGANSKEIEDIFTDDVLEHAKFYRDMLMEELSTKDEQRNALEGIGTKLDHLEAQVEKVNEQLKDVKSCTKAETQTGFQELHGSNWDAWLDFRDNVQNFECHKNNFILLTDALAEQDLENFLVLRCVPWKIVLDFDSFSEERGMYHNFATKEDKNSLIDMYTPSEIERRHASASNLARTIDTRKTQWMFVRGREKDNLADAGIASETFEKWKISSVKHLNGFLRCCSDQETLDKHKPVICVILPFLDKTVPFLKVILKRLLENFNEFPLRFVGLKHNNIDALASRFGIRLSQLSPCLLSLGLKALLETSPGKEYCIPTCQADLPAKLTNNQLLHLQEYLDVLYVGCEDLPEDTEDEEKFENLLSEHRKSFLSGNWISFVSLFDNHDARREIGKEIQNHIQRLLEKGPTHLSTIVEILHLPGTGGSTIARRVLWELHKYFPCAIAKLDGYKYIEFDEDYHFIDALADRITEMHEICQTSPLILLDGRHGSLEALCNKLVRALNSRGQRAVLLSCLHQVNEDVKYKELSPEVHRRFFVKGKLEECVADQRAFEAKYKDYIDELKEGNKTRHLRSSRVFHFPLLAMLKGLEGFQSKLDEIVFDSFDEMEGLQKEIAALVAFIQHYAAQETPASLVYKVFKQYVSKGEKEERITYEEINKLITEHLLNLMVPAKPTRNRGLSATSKVIPETYTFQHPIIADLVLRRYYTTQRCDVFTLAKGFLDYPIFQDDQFFVLVYDLFIRRSSRKTKNSILFEDLKSKNIQEAARLFCDLANKTGNAIVYAHAARFHANKTPPSFQDAIELITEAFECNNAQRKKRIICDMKGGILQSHLKFMIENNQVTTLEMLEDLASRAINSYRQAKTWPPTYPGPFTGEVKVWINCIDWITSNVCDGDTDKVVKYINSPEVPPFFSTCINDSFYLLDIVDNIIGNEPTLPEPGETRDLVDSLRMSLLKTFNKSRKSGRRRTANKGLIQTCRRSCSSTEFPKCSQSQLKRLQAHFILSQVKDIEQMKTEDREFLLSLLEYLVLENREDTGNYTYMAHHLMNVALHVTGPKLYSLDKGLQVADIWMQESSYNPKPYFYKMIINFLHILDGKQVMCRDSYNKALSKCKELSENKCPRWVPTHFLNKNGEGMTRLITRNALVSGEPGYSQNIASFWITESRKKLLECSGRIRIRPKSGKRKQQVYIELVQGNVELYVSKNADIGNVGQDYPQGTMVYFVVGFNLDGPLAYGITFEALHQ